MEWSSIWLEVEKQGQQDSYEFCWLNTISYTYRKLKQRNGGKGKKLDKKKGGSCNVTDLLNSLQKV